MGFKLTRAELRQLDDLVERHKRLSPHVAEQVSRSSVIVQWIRAAHAEPEQQRQPDRTTDPTDVPLDTFFGSYVAAAATGTSARLYLEPDSDMPSVRAAGRRIVHASYLITAVGTAVPGEVPLVDVTATCTTTVLGKAMRLFLVPGGPTKSGG